ncbi:PREDICTED: uncharacterized protein LOC106748893 [Dinoponera quadriceps]|uniref:Uncharacterized protein LOC106748893 n=1 Tax=Dinoponera quadriceps TaxID=609295 RepID=A0A6P3XYZ0_DINQU|nr:PREDICTED: uncharacterized protein LOC106748893 [Dinoponera quadriceps]
MQSASAVSLLLLDTNDDEWRWSRNVRGREGSLSAAENSPKSTDEPRRLGCVRAGSGTLVHQPTIPTGVFWRNDILRYARTISRSRAFSSRRAPARQSEYCHA